MTHHLHALVIGIDDYPYVYANPLRGCRNDAERMAGLLTAGFGFEVRSLLDREATRAGILGAMDELLEQAKKDDRVVLHFSGHGSQIKTREGDSVESLLPHDSGRGEHPNRDVTDREIYGWLLRLTAKTPYVTLIFDSCHAGGIVRDLEVPARGVEADERPAALADKQAFNGGATRQGGDRDPGPSGWLPLSERYTLIAACRDGERSRELEDPATGRFHGAFTCFLAEELERRRGEMSYRDVFERVAARVSGRYREQNPQLEGAWDRQVLASRHLPPMRFVPVRARRGDRIELAAGAAHGLVKGSEWQVFPPGTRRRTEEEPLGRLRIDELQAVSATGKLLDEVAPGAVEAPGRAVEVSRPADVRRLGVRLEGDGSRVDELAKRIDASGLLDRAADGAPWTLVVHRLAPRERMVSDTTVPQLGRLARPTWAVADGSGRLAMAPKMDSLEGVDRLLRGLEAWARYRALAEMSHPDPDHPLRGVLDIELLRKRPRDAWRPAEPGPSGEVVYEEGDLLGIRLRHGYEAPLHVTVLDLGLAGAVSPLYPVRGASSWLPPWRDLEIALGEQEALELYVPEELPYGGEVFEQGLETLVFLVSTQEADFALLAQEGFRAGFFGELGGERPQPAPAVSATNGLSALLRIALAGRPQRDAREHLPRAGPGLWTITRRRFWLRRPEQIPRPATWSDH